MIKKEDNIRSESYYPILNKDNDVSDKNNIPKETPLSEDQLFNKTKFEWPNSYWFIAERTNGRLATPMFIACHIV